MTEPRIRSISRSVMLAGRRNGAGRRGAMVARIIVMR
jgi:hypothetical protein